MCPKQTDWRTEKSLAQILNWGCVAFHLFSCSELSICHNIIHILTFGHSKDDKPHANVDKTTTSSTLFMNDLFGGSHFKTKQKTNDMR